MTADRGAGAAADASLATARSAPRVLSPADVSAFDAHGCLRGIPGSHTWGVLRHEEFTETALANWPRVVAARARRLFHDSRYAPSQAYGGHRPAT